LTAPQDLLVGDQPNTCPTCGSRTHALRTETGPDGWDFSVEQCGNAACAEIHNFHPDHEDDE